MTQRLHPGLVWVNTYPVHSVTAPIGGKKHSGVGCEYGLGSVMQYPETKAVMISTSSGIPTYLSVPR